VAELSDLVEPLARVLIVSALVLGILHWRAPPVVDVERGEAKASLLPVISTTCAVLCVVVTLVSFPIGGRDVYREITIVPYASLGLIFSWYVVRSSSRETLRWFGAVLFLAAGGLAGLMISDICRAATRTL
jgi:hypothetical protein